MQAVCTRCGQVCPEPGARFCGSCGARLELRPDAEGAAPTSLPPAEPALGAELLGARCAAHPDLPARNVCSRCGAFACAACVRLDSRGKPLCAACGDRVHAGQWEIPWERRGEVGLVKAYWSTAKEAAFEPERAFAGMNPHGKWWDAISYAMVSTFLGASGTIMLYFAIGAGAAIIARAEIFKDLHGGAAAAAVVGVVVGGLIALAVLLALGTLWRVYLGAGIDHLSLMLVGAGKGGFEATFRSYCYAMSPGIFGLIPGCGSYVFEIWRMVLSVFAYKSVHKTTGTRATIAVVIPVAICCGGYLALVIGVQALGAAANQ